MEHPFDLTGKVALVTGGSEGIGRGIAKSFLENGAKVIITGRTREKLEQAKEELGDGCFSFSHDVTDKDRHQELLNFAEEKAGGLDILVNNAGKHLKKSSVSTSDEEFQSVLDVNLNSVFALTRSAMNGTLNMETGSVIFISSMTALYGLPKVAAYSSSKSGLLGLMRTLASEHSHTGVRFNTIAPGFIESDMLKQALEDDPERKERILQRTPARRLGTTEEIGHAAVFLASDAASFITGVCLPVDGGNSIGF